MGVEECGKDLSNLSYIRTIGNCELPHLQDAEN